MCVNKGVELAGTPLLRDRARLSYFPQACPHDGRRRTVTSEPGKGSVFTVRLPTGASHSARDVSAR
jgi:hypothetical protein